MIERSMPNITMRVALLIFMLGGMFNASMLVLQLFVRLIGNDARFIGDILTLFYWSGIFFFLTSVILWCVAKVGLFRFKPINMAQLADPISQWITFLGELLTRLSIPWTGAILVFGYIAVSNDNSGFVILFVGAMLIGTGWMPFVFGKILSTIGNSMNKPKKSEGTS